MLRRLVSLLPALWPLVAPAQPVVDDAETAPAVVECAARPTAAGRERCFTELLEAAASARAPEPGPNQAALDGCMALSAPVDRLLCYDVTLGRQGDAGDPPPAFTRPPTTAAPVEPPSAALRACAGLSDDAERLSCYDTTVGRTPTETAPAAADSADAGEPAPPPSPLARRWQLVAQTERGPFVITPYKPTYVLPVSYNARPNRNDDARPDRAEVEFQLSFKAKVWPNLLGSRGDLWFGYTQKSFWQAYRSSSPFRESNYEPELVYSYKTRFSAFGLHGRLLTVGLNHQSNGRREPESRSWNRVTAGALFDHGDFAFQTRAWWRIPESAEEDDNPDIVDYMGRGELRGFYQHEERTLALMLRSNVDPDDVRGAVQLDYSFPLNGALKGYVQLFHGYGDSLIDYDHVSTRIGIGLMLTDWL